LSIHGVRESGKKGDWALNFSRVPRATIIIVKDQNNKKREGKYGQRSEGGGKALIPEN